MQYSDFNIGTSGWSYQHWKEIFYPFEMKSTAWLTFYAEKFKVTEINTSFYHLPKPATVTGWVNKVPSDFLFCPKISRYLTHIKRLKEPEEPLERFFEIFYPIKNNLGPVLVQLPPSFKFDYDRAEHFYKMLKQKYSDYDFAMEVRHNTWMEEESLTLMSKYDIAFIISQSGSRFPYGEIVTAKNVYIRFHGPESLYSSSYTDSQLHEFAMKFKNWIKEGHQIWAFFNNDIGGYAFANAQTLIQMMQTKDVNQAFL